MGIELEIYTIDNAEAAGDWEVIDSGDGIADSDYPPKQGSQCIEWEMSPNSEGGVRNSGTVSYDCRIYETGIWFLNPVADNDGNILLDSDSERGVYLRLYSGSDWADYYQPQHRKSNGDWKGGWLYIRGSGNPGEEDRNSGTWGTSQCSNIDKAAVMVKGGDGDSTDKNSAKFGTDWSKYYNKIIITGVNEDDGDRPWTLKDIFEISEDKQQGDGVWGIVNNSVDFYEINAGIQFGDGSGTGSFTMKNEYLLLDSFSDAQKQNIEITDNFTVEVGIKDDTGEKTYTKDGVNITSSNFSNLEVTNQGIFHCYDTKIQGFNSLLFGEGGSNSIDIIQSDLYNNNTLSLNSSGLNILSSRLYFNKDNKKDIGSVDIKPNNIYDIKVFQVLGALELNQNMDIEKYSASDTQYDIILKEGIEVDLINSDIDPQKIKRI